MENYIIIQDREAGNFIESFKYLQDAKNKIVELEEMDKKDEIFVPNFYEIKFMSWTNKKKSTL